VKVHWLTAEQVVEAHVLLLERWGGASGGGHRGSAYQGAEAAVNAVKNSYYEDVHELAAAYAVYVVQGHVFMDGNKRAGQAAAEIFLESNGLRTSFGAGVMPKLMIELQGRSEKGENVDSLVAWLAERLRG